MTKFIFLGGRGAYVDLFYVPAELLHYFFVHNLFKKKDGSTRYSHIKVGQREGYFINFINGGGEKCTQIRYAI